MVQPRQAVDVECEHGCKPARVRRFGSLGHC
jgi:hypothetical protein